MGIGEPSFSSSQPLSISSSRWLWVEILDLLNHIFPIKLKLESKKPTEPGNVLTILNFRGGNMGTGEPSFSSWQPLSFSSSRWLWVEVSDLLCFHTCSTLLLSSFWFSLVKARGVHGSGWDFLPNPPWWVKKYSTQPNPSHKSNPTHMGWVGLGWTHGLDNFFFITIIIKLSRKNISHLPKKYTLIYKLIFQLSCKQNLFKYPIELIKKI